MNKITITAVVAIGLCTAFAPIAINAQSKGSSYFGAVMNPEIPRNIKFAGETVDLDREDYYERLDRELTSMVYTHGNTLLTIKRANRYFPELEPILKKNGLNTDYLYLACIESNLNPLAKSTAGAAGIWQFMPATARQYGLEVNDEIDERYNVQKETEAACRYLKSAIEKYGNWASAAASYNAGGGKISSELGSQGVPDALDLWLVEETRRYPFRMLAMKMIMENPKNYGFLLKDRQLYQPFHYTEEKVTGSVASWPAWAKARGIDYNTLREFNPWIRDKKLTNRSGKTYIVRLPANKGQKRSELAPKTYNKNWTR